MKYYAKLTKQSEGRYLVEFPDLSGCLTEGDTLKDALLNASEALDGWLEVHFDQAHSVPTGKIMRGKNYYPICVDPKIALAVALREVRRKRKLSQTQVAKMLGIDKKSYAKFELPAQANPSLSTIRKIADVLGIETRFDLVS